ncbi:MAG: nucleotidyl transferase AbiEii/AbiGii toxin family protein [Isosphaeraceae bacterium]
MSKGWGLIQRFSEDVDIFLDPTAFEPPLGKKGIDRELIEFIAFLWARWARSDAGSA